MRCILYPDTQIKISSKSRKQAIEVLQKIQTIILPKSDNLKIEIAGGKIIINNAEAYIEFKGGSTIKVVTANDNSRCGRANILIIDEFRMVNKDIIDKVLKKFLTSEREPKFLNKPEYKNYPKERNKQFYLSSAWLKSHWAWEKVQSFCTNMVDTSKNYFICGLPYQLSVKEGLLNKKDILDEMSETDFNEFSWSMKLNLCAP